MLQQTIHNIQVSPRRVVISKFVLLAYVGPNRYKVEFHRNGRAYHITKERSGNNRWLLYLYAITRLEPFTGGLRVLK